MEKYRIIILLTVLALSTSTFAQSEAGLLLGAEADKKLSKKLSISMEAEMRMRNDFKTMDRWAVGLGAQYKLTNWLKADAGYKLLNTNFREDERWQYTYRPEKTVQRWDYDDESWEDKVRAGKGKNQLRSRLEISYDRKNAFFTPFASMELYNSWGIEKIRYNIGTDLRISKQHNLSIYYRYQNMKHVNADDYEPDMHYIGVGYKFKF